MTRLSNVVRAAEHVCDFTQLHHARHVSAVSRRSLHHRSLSGTRGLRSLHIRFLRRRAMHKSVRNGPRWTRRLPGGHLEPTRSVHRPRRVSGRQVFTYQTMISYVVGNPGLSPSILQFSLSIAYTVYTYTYGPYSNIVRLSGHQFTLAISTF